MGFFGKVWDGIKSGGRWLGKQASTVSNALHKATDWVKNAYHDIKEFIKDVPVVGGALHDGIELAEKTPLGELVGDTFETVENVNDKVRQVLEHKPIKDFINS